MENIERKNLVWVFVIIGFLSLLSIATYQMHEYYIYLTAYLWFGFVYGMCLQYGRFCFSSAFRDLFAVGVPRMAVGIVIAMVLFGTVSAFVTATGNSTFHPAPYGIHSVIAGFIFGVGMVLTGGCASGSLYKAGEGNATAMLVILSISVSQAIFADIGGWTNNLVPYAWHQSAIAKGLAGGDQRRRRLDGSVPRRLCGDQPVLLFSKWLGLGKGFVGAYVGDVFVGIVLPASALLVAVYSIWYRKGYLRKQAEARRPTSGLRVELAGYWSMIMASKRTAIAGLVLGIAAGLHMYVMKGMQLKFGVTNFGTLMKEMGITFGLSAKGTVFDPGYWYVTTQEAQWVGWVFNKLGADNMDNIYFGLENGLPNPLINPADWMSLALIGGAAVMALLHNEFKWKGTTRELAMWAIIGGTLMGIGSRLGLGCNVGAFFVRVSQGDVSGWLFGIGMIGGAYIGVMFFNWWTERKMAREMAACDI